MGRAWSAGRGMGSYADGPPYCVGVGEGEGRYGGVGICKKKEAETVFLSRWGAWVTTFLSPARVTLHNSMIFSGYPRP